jgi:hypothetical protein
MSQDSWLSLPLFGHIFIYQRVCAALARATEKGGGEAVERAAPEAQMGGFSPASLCNQPTIKVIGGGVE